MAIKINFQLDILIGTFNLNDTGQHSDCTENLLLFLYAYAAVATSPFVLNLRPCTLGCFN